MAESNLKKKTAKGLIWGGIGNGGMLVLNLLFGIVLSRILSPGDYGMIGALTIFSAVAGTFTESGFTLAIINIKKADTRAYSSVFWFNVAMGAVMYTALYFLSVPIASFYRTPEMVPLARFLFLSFVFGCLGTAPAGYLLRNLMVKQRSKSLIIATAVSGIAGISCALAGMAYWGIAVQTVTYTLTMTLMQWHYAGIRPAMQFSWTTIKGMLPFSLKQLTVALFNNFNNNFFAALLSRFYGMKTTGYYTQGNKWTTMGYSTINGMIYNVGQPVIRQTVGDQERMIRAFRKLLRFTAFITFPAMMGLAIVSREVIVITITDKWLPSVHIMQILCIGGAFMPIATLYGNLFNSINRPSVYMWNTITVGAAQTLAVILTYSYGMTTMLTVYVAINILWLGIWQWFARRFAGIRTRRVLMDIVPLFLATAAVMAVTVFLTSPITNIYLSLVAKILIAAALYILLMWSAKSAILREAIRFLRHKQV